MKNPNKLKAGWRILAKDVMTLNDSMESGLSGHDIVCGGSGAGKTGSYVEPNISMLDHSMVIMDTKGRLFKKYNSYLEAKGFRVLNIDFVHPEDSISYNPLDHVHVYEEATEDHPISYRQIDLKRVAESLVSESNDKDDMFWITTCRNTLITMMAFVMETLPKEERHMGSVVEVYMNFTRELSEHRSARDELKVSFFEQLAVEDPDSFAVMMYRKLSFDSDKTWGCNEIFVGNALEIFSYTETRKIFGASSAIDLASVGREKTALFINTSDTNRMMDPIVNVFINQLLQELVEEADRHDSGELDVAVRLILDDFSCGTKINDFDKLISVIRSRRIYVSMMLQSVSQLQTLYSNSQAKTILANCDCKIFFGGQDKDTAEYLADIVGKLPKTLMNLKNGEAVVVIRGQGASFTERIKPYSMGLDGK